MGQLAPRILAVLGSGALGWMVAGIPGASLLGLAAAAVAAMSGCRHPGPLGLLPAVLGEDGKRRPERWYCPSCGRTFPTVDYRGAAPVQRFEGYDQTKAVEAARRADDIGKRQRQIAMERSERAMPRPAPVRRERAPRPIEIQNRRAG